MPAFFYPPIVGRKPQTRRKNRYFRLPHTAPPATITRFFSNPALPERPKTETDSPIANSLQNSLILSKAIKQPCFYGA